MLNDARVRRGAADFVILLLEVSGNKSVKLFALVINS
jgi:hypothetical protein